MLAFFFYISPMNITELIGQLKQHGAWIGRKPEKAWLKEYVVDTLKENFEMYYEDRPHGHWNEGRTVFTEPIDLPDEYIDFLREAQFESAQLGGPYGMTVFCGTTMLYRTINWMNVHDGKEYEPRYWINMAERGDKGFIYMCCDTKSKFYGKVVEFYDDAPWNHKSSVPEDGEPGDEVYGTFTEFLEQMVAGYGGRKG